MIKILSGRQPWWYWLLHGKSIENRVAESSAHKGLLRYRGWLLLHASASIGSIDEFDDACHFIRGIASREDWDDFARACRVHGARNCFVPREALARGGIIGRARCVGLIEPDGRPYGQEGSDAVATYKPDMRWHIPGQWGHILADVKPCPFVPWKGALGLQDAPQELVDRIAALANANTDFQRHAIERMG